MSVHVTVWDDTGGEGEVYGLPAQRLRAVATSMHERPMLLGKQIVGSEHQQVVAVIRQLAHAFAGAQREDRIVGQQQAGRGRFAPQLAQHIAAVDRLGPHRPAARSVASCRSDSDRPASDAATSAIYVILTALSWYANRDALDALRRLPRSGII